MKNKNKYNYSKNIKCLDCHKLIKNDSIRCNKCMGIVRSKNYKGTKFLAKMRKKNKKKICLICNKEFIQNISIQKYCSKKCSRQGYKEWNREYDKTYKRKKYKQIYYQNNKSKIDKRNLKYYQEHREEYKEHTRNKYKTNVNFKLSNYLRSRIYHVIKKNRKSLHTMELLGCSLEKLKQHLQNQFKKGMTWENYGLYGWHIDHIKPCSRFDLSKPKEQRKCFNYTNLQPLWAKENWSKNNRE